MLITWEGNLVCPWHGELASTQNYEPGPALCGCEFRAWPGGLLVAVRADQVVPDLQTSGENAG